MINYLFDFPPMFLSLLGGSIAFLFSILGSAIIFLFKNTNKYFMNSMIALSAGVMLSASIFSLLIPGINNATILYKHPTIIISISFILGGLIIYFSNFIFNYIFKEKKKHISKIMALFTSITLHNIPEGLVIGVAFGTLFYDKTITCLISAISLTLGIALQNFPEGSALSIPLSKTGLSSSKSFLLSCLSALVEPIAALIGALIVIKVKMFLPIILSLASGAMIYVTSMELIPECQENGNKDVMSILILFGFTIMMILEIILG